MTTSKWAIDDPSGRYFRDGISLEPGEELLDYLNAMQEDLDKFDRMESKYLMQLTQALEDLRHPE